MNIEKIKEKARIQALYMGLNYRLVQIASDLAKVGAQDDAHERKLKALQVSSLSEEETKDALFRTLYRIQLEKEAAEIRKITETPVIKHAEP